jgi:hypothetical protein
MTDLLDPAIKGPLRPGLLDDVVLAWDTPAPRSRPDQPD